MTRLLAILVTAAALPCRAGDITDVGGLVQDEFRRLSTDLGAAFSYKGVTPATPLGTLGFDIGLVVTDTSMEHSTLFARAGAGGQSHLAIGKLHLHKGLPGGFDIGAFVGGVPDVGASLYGADVRYAIFDDGLATPAVGIRASATRSNGLGPLDLGTAAIDLTVSKKFTLVTPYAGAGMVWIRSSASGTGLADERINQGRVFGGLNVNLVAVNLAFEAEKMGDNVSLSAKLGWRF